MHTKLSDWVILFAIMVVIMAIVLSGQSHWMEPVENPSDDGWRIIELKDITGKAYWQGEINIFASANVIGLKNGEIQLLHKGQDY